MNKFFIKVRRSTDDPSLTWEDRHYWDETGWGRELNEVVEGALEYLRKHDPTAIEIRVNQNGSLQGHYYGVKNISDDETFIWMTQQDASRLIRVFSKWLEATFPRRVYVARALRDMGNRLGEENGHS